MINNGRRVKFRVGRRENAGDGVAVLMNERVWRCVRKIRRINSRIMCVGVCIKREFWTVIVVFTSGMERLEEERDGFWEELKGSIKLCEDKGKAVLIRDMNAKVGDSEGEGVLGKVKWGNYDSDLKEEGSM